MKHNGRRPKLDRAEKAKRAQHKERTGRDFAKRYGGLARALKQPKEIK